MNFCVSWFKLSAASASRCNSMKQVAELIKTWMFPFASTSMLCIELLQYISMVTQMNANAENGWTPILCVCICVTICTMSNLNVDGNTNATCEQTSLLQEKLSRLFLAVRLVGNMLRYIADSSFSNCLTEHGSRSVRISPQALVLA